MLQVKAPKIAKRLPQTIETTKIASLLDSKEVFSPDFEGLRDELVIELFFGTGMRLAELLTLRDDDIDKWNKTIKVFGKRSKQRIIPLNPTLISLLEKYSAAKERLCPPTKALIVTKDGSAAYPKLVYRIVKKYLSLVSTQEKKSPHILRHTFATALLNNGADLNAIKELLGHASLAATQVYTHNSVERLKSIYKQAHPKA
jgi:integrase/recombinase XerC